MILLRNLFQRYIGLWLYLIMTDNSRMAIMDTVLPLTGGEDGKPPLFVRAKTLSSAVSMVSSFSRAKQHICDLTYNSLIDMFRKASLGWMNVGHINVWHIAELQQTEPVRTMILRSRERTAWHQTEQGAI